MNRFVIANLHFFTCDDVRMATVRAVGVAVAGLLQMEFEEAQPHNQCSFGGVRIQVVEVHFSRLRVRKVHPVAQPSSA